MILILEDDADREAYQRRNPFNEAFYDDSGAPPRSGRAPTVWISPEAYAKEAVLADLRAKVEALHDAAAANYKAKADHYYEGMMDGHAVVLDLLDGSSE